MNDSRRRWITLAASLLASLCVGFGYAWSILMEPMKAAFGWSTEDVALSFTVIFVFGAIAALVAGKALQYVQPRTLLLIGGALFGAGLILVGSASSLVGLYAAALLVGFGLGIVCPGATISNSIRFFPDKKGLASGLVIAGYGLGAVVWAPVAVALIERHGLTWTLWLLGVVFFAVIALCSRFVRTAPPGFAPQGWSHSLQGTSRIHDSPDKDWRGMLRAPLFYALAALFVAGTLGGNLIIGLASPIAQETLGISPAAAGAIVSFLALALVVGKLVWGIVSDRIGRYPVFCAMFALSSAALASMWVARGYAPLVLGIVIVGFCYGGFLALIGPTTADAFGSQRLPVNYGIMFLTVAVSATVGPRLGAVIQQAQGSYANAFLLAAVVNAAGLVLAVAMALGRSRAQSAVAPGPRGRSVGSQATLRQELSAVSLKHEADATRTDGFPPVARRADDQPSGPLRGQGKTGHASDRSV